jgi:hypothetical protein
MKFTLLFLMLFTINAYATDRNPHANAGAIGLGISNANSSSNSTSNGSASASNGLNVEDRLQIPNSPGLSSGSSNTTSPHRIYKQRQLSFILGGYTAIDMELDIVSFVGSNPSDDQQLAACIQSEDFRAFRKLKGFNCPQ